MPDYMTELRGSNERTPTKRPRPTDPRDDERDREMRELAMARLRRASRDGYASKMADPRSKRGS